MFPSHDQEGEVNIHPIEQLQKMKEGQWLILARDRYRLDKLEDDLKTYGYYYKRGDKTSINKKIHEAIVGWEDLRKGKEITIKGVKSCYAYMKTGEGVDAEHKGMKKADKEKLYNYETLKKDFGLKIDKELPWFKALVNIPASKSIYFRAVLRRGENIRHEPRIKLSTIHGSKSFFKVS